MQKNPKKHFHRITYLPAGHLSVTLTRLTVRCFVRVHNRGFQNFHLTYAGFTENKVGRYKVDASQPVYIYSKLERLQCSGHSLIVMSLKQELLPGSPRKLYQVHLQVIISNSINLNCEKKFQLINAIQELCIVYINTKVNFIILQKNRWHAFVIR